MGRQRRCARGQGKRGGSSKKLTGALLWELRWGPKVEYYQQRGWTCPDKIPQKPAVKPHLIFYWNAFWELSSDRPSGRVLGRIPFLAIEAFARRYDINDIDAFDRFRTIIRGIDAAFRAEMERKPASSSTQDVDGVRNLLQRLAKNEKA